MWDGWFRYSKISEKRAFMNKTSDVKPTSSGDSLNSDWDDEDDDSQKGKFLTFVLGREEFGIEIANVTEIIGLQKINEVPDMPSFVRGVINLRGNVIPVMDVRDRFSMDRREYVRCCMNRP
jgi:purine-binding chemotaxis protein CheW